MKDTGIDHQAYRPSVIYINGVYWGILNIREKKNLDYLVPQHGIDPDNVELLEDDYKTRFGGVRVREGDSEHFFGMYNFILDNNMSDPANYDHVKSLMDVNNFINYFVSQIYVLNQEWPWINVKLWRPRTPGGRWRWMMFDVDSGMHIGPQYENMFELLTCRVCGWGSIHTDMFNKLQENQNFRNDVLNRFSDYLNTIFSVETVLPVIEKIKNTLEPEMPNHLARWGYDIHTLDTMDEWYAAVDTVISFAERRPAILRGEIIEEFNLSGTAAINLDVSSSEAGKIKINTLVLENYPWDGIYFRGVPVQLTALPNLGYRFVGWTGVQPEDTSSVEVVLTDSLSVTAVFEKIVGEDIVIDISQSPYKIESDQTVLSGTSLTVEAGVELIKSENSNREGNL